MHIAFFETNADDERILQEYLKGQGASFSPEKLTLENVQEAKDSAVVSVFINSKITKEIIDMLPNLKHIVTRSTGYDHIDYAYAQEKEISVSNVPAYGSQTVAEFTFALLLTLSRKIFDAYHQVREEGDFAIEQLEGFDLYGKTLGVIGTGKIGRHVIQIAQGFGMKILAYDVHPDENFARERGFTYQSFQNVLGQSDIVTLHVPYMKETHHLINAEALAMMKEGAYLLNTSRGEVIDTGALVKALQTKHLAGAGLDVLEGERELHQEAEFTAGAPNIQDMKKLIQDHILIDMRNVIVTPHIAFFSREAKHNILETTAQNIDAFLKGNPQNLVS